MSQFDIYIYFTSPGKNSNTRFKTGLTETRRHKSCERDSVNLQYNKLFHPEYSKSGESEIAPDPAVGSFLTFLYLLLLHFRPYKLKTTEGKEEKNIPCKRNSSENQRRNPAIRLENF